ncbi:MAG: InlB B-repeat-containing protein [Firmicutes bacterium]|nr:InlB B-repeat-containing protein [Bacillota bacterium]
MKTKIEQMVGAKTPQREILTNSVDSVYGHKAKIKGVLCIFLICFFVGLSWVFVACGDKTTYVRLSFECDGGEPIAAIMVEKGTKVVAPNAPKRDGYDFVDWYENAAYTQRFSFETKLEKDWTVYAKWEKNEDGGDTEEPGVNPEEPDDTPEGITPELPPLQQVDQFGIAYWDNDGHRFGGVFVSEQGECLTSVPSVHTNGEDTLLPFAQKRGYDFVGWYLYADFSGVAITMLDKSVAFEHDIFLYARWAARVYTIEYQSNVPDNTHSKIEGSTESGQGAYDEYTELAANGFALNGYTFLGWAVSANEQTRNLLAENETVYINALLDKVNEQVSQNQIIVLYAVWDANLYEVKFDNLGGQNGQELQEVYFDAGLADVSTPTKDGYTFAGYYTKDWRRGQTNSGFVYDSNGQSVVDQYTWNKDIVLFASWESNVYQITLDYDGGQATDGQPSVQVNYGMDYCLPVPTKEGYDFVAWVDKNGVAYTDELGQSLAYYTDTVDIALVASYVEQPVDAARIYDFAFDEATGGYEIKLKDDADAQEYLVGNLVLPSVHKEDDTIGYLPVTKISDFGFSQDVFKNINLTQVESITLSGTVQVIGVQAFASPVLADKPQFEVLFEQESALQEIQKEAFLGAGIKSFVLPNTCQKIGDSAFAETRLESFQVDVDSQLSEIGVSAFRNAFANAENVKPSQVMIIPKTVQKIGKSAFEGCGETINGFVGGNLKLMMCVSFEQADKWTMWYLNFVEDAHLGFNKQRIEWLNG